MADAPAGAPAGQGADGAPAGQGTDSAPAEQGADGAPGPFERDTAVALREERGVERVFDATVADGWRAGRGPHGGYLAAMILRGLRLSVPDPLRAPRSLTIHYARAPRPGPVTLRTVLEREGRSLSTLSARLEQNSRLIALATSAFSLPWPGPELRDVQMPAVAPPQPGHPPGSARAFGAPPFTEHMIMEPRMGERQIDGRRPMEFAAWVGLAEARPLDALTLAFFSDALIPAPFPALEQVAPAPTIDLTVHFRVALPRRDGRGAPAEPGPSFTHELCFVQVKAGVIHEGFFEEDSMIWAADGTLLAQSRQLALLMPETTTA